METFAKSHIIVVDQPFLKVPKFTAIWLAPALPNIFLHHFNDLQIKAKTYR